MKHFFITLTILIEIGATTPASAAVNFYRISLQTSEDGWITKTSNVHITQPGARLFNVTIDINGAADGGKIFNSRVWMLKFDPATPFYSAVWRSGGDDSELTGSISTIEGKLLYSSEWSGKDYVYSCSPIKFMSLTYQYSEGLEPYTFEFYANPQCSQ